MSNPTIIEIVEQYLRANGYDALVRPEYECGCSLDDLAPCGQIHEHCQAAYRWTCDKCELNGDCEFQEGYPMECSRLEKPEAQS